MGLGLLLSASLRASAAILQLSTATLTSGTTGQISEVVAYGGSLYSVGFSSGGASGKDIWLGRWDAGTLALISSVAYNGSANGDDEASGVALDPATGDLYVAGYSSITAQGPVVWLGKFNSSLGLVSSTTLNVGVDELLGSIPAQPSGIILAPNGNLYLANRALSGSNTVMGLEEFTTSLALVSSTTFFNGNNPNYPFRLAADNLSNIYLCGGVAPAPATSLDLWLGKFTSSLVFVASATAAGGGGNLDEARDIKIDPANSSVFATGLFNTSGVVFNIWLGKYTLNLAPVNSVTVTGIGVGSAGGSALVLTSTRVYVAGKIATSSNARAVYVGEFDYSLNNLSSATFHSNATAFDEGFGAVLDTATSVLSVGGNISAPGPQTPWLGKFALSGLPPTVAVLSPAVAYSQSISVIAGTAAAGNNPVALVQFRVRDTSTGNYWDPGNSTFDLPAGSSELAWANAVNGGNWLAWSASSAIPWVSGTMYDVVARSIDQLGQYSTPYSTATTTFDNTTPSSFVMVPQNGSNAIGNLPTISGTASDAASGVLNVSVRISSGPSFGTCWNAASWVACPASLSATGTGSWTVSAGLLPGAANLVSGNQYKIVSSAVDGAGNIEPGGPPVVVNYLNFGTAGNLFAPSGSGVASGNGQNERGFRIAVDTVTSGAPYYYATILSTTDPNFAGPFVDLLMKYDATGSPAGPPLPLKGTVAGALVAVDGSGNVYATSKLAPPGGGTAINLTKFSPALVPLASISLDTNAVGNVDDLVSDGSFLYTVNDGASTPYPTIIKYDTNLVAVATATYANGSGIVGADAIALDGAGNVFADVLNATATVRHLIKFSSNTANWISAPAADADLSGTVAPRRASIAASPDGAKVYVAAYGPGPGAVYVNEYDGSNLAYSGVTSTTTGSADPLGLGAVQLRTAADGTVFLSYTDAYDGPTYPGHGDDIVIKFDANLNFQNSRAFNGPTGSTDAALGMAVVDSSNVVVTGASRNGAADFDASTVRLSLFGNPGGQVFASAASLTTSTAPVSAAGLPMLGVGLWAQNGPASLNTLTVGLTGNAPASNIAYVSLYADTDGSGNPSNGDGLFESSVDTLLSSAPFSATFPPLGNLTVPAPAFSTLGGTTRYFFLTVTYGGLSVGRALGLTLPSPGSLGLSPGFPSGQGYPLNSGLDAVQQLLFANPVAQGAAVPAPAPAASGGYDTGLNLSPGQTVVVTASGTWNTGGFGATDATGLGATGGLAGGLRIGSLVGRVGGGNWFQLASSATLTASQNGDLFLAMNDTSYADNTGSISVGAQVLVSTRAKVWTAGSGFNFNASINANWLNGQPPLPGDSVLFDGSATNQPCNWDIGSLNLNLLTLATSYAGTVTMGAGTQVTLSSSVVIGSGTFTLGSGSILTVQGETDVKPGGTLNMGPGGGVLQVSKSGVVLIGGSFVSNGASNAVLQAANPNDGFPFRALAGSVSINGAGGLTFVNPTGFVVGSSATVALNRVNFVHSSAATSADVVFNAPNVLSPVSFSFSGLSFDANTFVNIDASSLPSGSTVAVANATGPRMGSPFDNDPYRVVSWSPDGGASGSISGTVTNGGTGSGPVYVAYALAPNTGDRKSFDGAIAGSTAAMTIALSTTAGSYSLAGLAAPNTYYLMAWRTTNASQLPQSFDPVGGYSHIGLLWGSPVYVPAGGQATGADITIRDRTVIQGTVTNGSSQFGPIVVQAWKGAPHAGDMIAAKTFPSAAAGGGALAYSFGVPAADGVTMGTTDLYVMGFVDVNGNGTQEPFEAQATSASVTAVALTTMTGVDLNITGGSAAAGGVVTASATSVHPGYVGTAGSNTFSLPQAMLKLSLAPGAQPASITSLRVDMAGTVPASAYQIGVWRDDLSNGVFDSSLLGGSGPFDAKVGETSVAGGVSSGVVVLSEFLPAGTTTTYFVTLNLLGQTPAGPVAVAITTSDAFGLSQGAMASQPALYPAASGAAQVLFATRANWDAEEGGYGGEDAGLAVAAGQTFTVFSHGQWSPDSGAATTPDGRAGTLNEATLVPAALQGQLIARIDDGAGGGTDWFPVTSGVANSADFTGEIFLAMNDFAGAYFDNAGAIYSSFTVAGSTTVALQGTISYTGTIGTGLLSIRAGTADANCPGCPNSPFNVVSTITVPMSVFASTTLYSYSFDAVPPAAAYVVDAFVNDAPSQTGNSGFPVDAQTVGSTVTDMDFSMALGAGSIGGSISYSGVQNSGDFFVAVTTSTDLQNNVYFFGAYSGPSTAYSIPNLPTPNTYYMVGFRDVNGDHQPDGPEPFGVVGVSTGAFFDLPSLFTPIFLDTGATAGGVTLTMVDRAAISGSVTVSSAVQQGYDIAVVIGHGNPLSDTFQEEDVEFIWYDGSNTHGAPQPFTASLLRPATDYSVFAFVDANNDGFYDPTVDASGMLLGPINAPSGGFANANVVIGAGSVPPPPVTGFSGQPGASQVFWNWNLSPGATAYQLRDSTFGVVAVLGASASNYTDVLAPSSPSAIVAITAANGFGASGPAGSTPLAALPALPGTPTPLSVFASSAVLNWAANGNTGGLYQVSRATAAGGPFFVSTAAPSALVVDVGLSPATPYFYKVQAFNINGASTAFTATGSLTTQAPSGPSILGIADYAGTQGPRVLVQAFTNAASTGSPSSQTAIPPGRFQPYYLTFLTGGTYYVRAFADAYGDGVFHNGEDFGQWASTSAPSPVVVAAGPVVISTLTMSADATPPAFPVNLSASAAGLGLESVSWQAPALNADGTPLVDLAGYRLQRGAAAAGPFTTIASLSSATLSYADSGAPAGSVVYYRVAAADLAGNLSAFTNVSAAQTSAGGTISGSLSYIGTTTQGPFRVRLSTTPFGSFIAETTVSPFSFTGLADGPYYVRAFRDLNGDSVQQDNEPGGALGGIAEPYQIPIFGGTSNTGNALTVCDRTPASFAGPGAVQSYPITISGAGCPAQDQGGGYFTSLLSFRAGGGAAGSVGVGSSVSIQMQSAFPNRLILLGPDGSVLQQDARPGGARLDLNVPLAGQYLIEPTSFNPNDGGAATVTLSVNGGFGGKIAGALVYSGAQTGQIVLQLYNTPSANSFPVFQTSTANPGNYAITGLPDNTYYLRAFRDSNGDFTAEGGEAAGSFGVSASTLTPIRIQGGVAFVNGTANAAVNVTLTDPAVGSISGQILRQGSQTGTIRVEVGQPQVNCTNCGTNLVTFATIVAAGPYAIPFVPPATNYVVTAYVDVNGNAHADPLEAQAQTSPVSVQPNSAASVNLVVTDPGSGASGNASISGVISYAGASTGSLIMAFATDRNFQNISYTLSQAGPGSYLKTGVLGNTSYYIAAFLDSNNNGEPDDGYGEPIGFYGASPSNDMSGMQPFFVSTGAAVAGFALTDASTGSINGQVSYTGTLFAGKTLVVHGSVIGGSGRDQRVYIPNVVGGQTYNYTLPYLAPSSSWTVSAFVDANGNGNQDFGEPSAFFGNNFCAPGTQCYGTPVTVSTGAGTFPAYGVNVTVSDPGQGNTSSNAGSIAIDAGYIGSQSGPIVGRLFTNSSYSGTPFKTITIPMPPGPGQVDGVLSGVPFGTYYVDAFRDPSGTGIYNPVFDAYGQLGSVTISANQNGPNNTGNGASIVDPGQGGSVNVYSGSFTAVGGSRFDGGAVDIGVTVNVDTITAGGPFVFVQGVTKQNTGIVSSLVKYSSAGVFLASTTLPTPDTQIGLPALDGSGNIYLVQDVQGGGVSSGTIVKYSPSLAMLQTLVISSFTDARSLAFANGTLYATLEGSYTGGAVVRAFDSSLNPLGDGLYSFPAAAFPGCQDCTQAGGDALTAGPGGVIYVVVKSQSNGNARFFRLQKYGPALGAPLADVDITALIPNAGNQGQVSLVADSGGNVFLALIPNGDSSARTYKFNSSLAQVASSSFGPLLSHFGGGISNLAISTNDYVYEAWESAAHGGDVLALRYDDNLNLISSRTFDGLDNAHEDFAFGVAVQNSSNVYVTGAATNQSGNLDWAALRLNMNAGGASSGAGAVVTITTANATNAVYGTLSYAGALVTSGTVRAVLLPLGSSTPIRLSSAPFAASVPYLFNNVPAGSYQVQAFIDGNGNLSPDAGEPVGFSTSTGFAFAAAGNSQLNVRLCDRRPIAFGTTLSGTITPADCPASDRGGASQRLYTFSGTRGQAATVEMDAVNFYDTYLNLYDPNLNLVASNDDGAGAGNARIANFLLPADGLYTIGASPFAAGLSSATFKLSLSGSAGSLGSLAGTVTYAGAQGGAVFVGLFSSSSFNNSLVSGANIPGPGAFSFSNLKTGATYYLGAFIDVNGNGNPDAGEDVGLFGSTAAGAAPLFLRSGQNVSGITFPIVPGFSGSSSSGTFAEITGVVSYATATQSGAMHVQFFSNSAFTGQPVSERVLSAVGSYDVPLPPNVPYYIRAYLDANANGALDATEPSGVYAPRGQGAEAVFAVSSGVIAGVDIAIADPGNTAAGLSGAGTASIAPATAPAGARVFTATITYTAGAGGIATGGRVGFTVPPGFSAPQFVTLASTSAATLSALAFSGGSAISTVTAGTLLPGEQVVFVYDLAAVPCSLSTATFGVSAAQNAQVPFLSLFAGSPSLQVVPGPVATLQPANPYFSLLQGTLSDAQSLEAHDACGNKTPLTSPLTATLTAKRFDVPTSSFLLDATVGLSSAASVSTSSVLSVPFAVGQSSSPFFAIAASTGAKNLEVVYTLGSPATFYYGMTALPAGALSNASVSTVSFAAGSSSASITPNGDGIADLAYFNFTMADPTQPWHIAVASSPFKSGVTAAPVWESWGQGQPLRGAIAWDGRYSPWLNGGARVPSGFYYVRIELGGSGVHDDSLIVVVSVPQLAGHFYDAGVLPNPPLSGASVSIYGPNGALSTLTDASGAYVLPGIVSGTYNMFVGRQDFLSGSLQLTVTASGTVSTFTALSGSSGTLNAAGGLDVLMSRSSVLLVSPSFAVGTSTPAADLWGGLQVQSSTSAAAPTPQSFTAPLHVAAGTTTFDDGGQWDPSVNAFVAHTVFRFAVAAGTYTVSANLPGVAPSTASVYVGPGVVALNLPPFVRKSSVSGLVTLPAGSNTLPNGVFVSINAVPLSTSTLVAGGFGGVQLPQGVLSGTYTVSGLDAGTYILRGSVPGLAAISTGPVAIPASSDVAHVDFPAFNAGAAIGGTVTIFDNTNGTQHLNVSAWAPGTLNFGSTNVVVAAGSNPVTVTYSIPGLSAGTTYQVFANLDQINGRNYFVTGPGGASMPFSAPAPQAALDFSIVPSSGVIAGTLILPAGSNDFLDVSLNGVTLASAKPDDVGRTFSVATSTNLPNFRCTADNSTPASGLCPVNNSSAAFTVQGENTETLAITFYDAATGQTAKKQLSVVNGATTTVVVDLSAPTFSISGAINNQVTNALFNTNPNVVANAPFIAPVGYPAGLSSSTARVEAVRIPDITQFNAAISTSFNPATTRVGFLTAAGTYTVTNLPSGSYVVRTVDLRACATCSVLVPAVSQAVSVGGASLSNVNFTLSDGFTVSGAISLDGGLLDAQTFQVTVYNSRQEVVRSTTVTLGDAGLGLTANSVNYSFANIPANGFYTLTVTGLPAPSKYAGAPIKFPNPSLSPSGLQSNLSAQNVTMLRAAMIVGRLQDANTGAQIGAAQAGLLAPNFAISATANPWTDGGYVVAASSISGRPVQGDGYFRVGPLLPNVTYDLKLSQTAWDPAFLLLGSQNYAPVTVSGLTPQPGETRDVGVISLNQGQSLTGTLRAGTTSGALLGGIEVDAVPAVNANGVTVQTFTNPQGRYTLWVSTFISNTYNLTAAPRAGANVSSGAVYGQAVLNNVNLLATTTADFVLAPLVSVVTGQVVVADAAAGGQLSYPFGANRGFPAAALNLQPQGVVPQSNPLGDITAISDQLGAFSVPGLSTGAYSLRATSLGYAVFNATVSVSTGGYHLFTVADTPPNQLPGNVLTLQRGATLTGRIVKSDGSAPNDQEVGGVAAANFAAGEFVIGSVDVDKTAHTVNSYTISGFKTGVAYSIVVIPADKTSDMVSPPEGTNVSFAAVESTTTKNLTLTFVPPIMDCVATSKNLGNGQFQIKVACTKSLRAQTSADSDLSQLIQVSTFTSLGAALAAPNGTGQFLGSDKTLSQDRREMTAIYRSVANESSFSIRVRAYAAAIDPKTGANFSIDKVFDFFTGLGSNVNTKVSNINGGTVALVPSGNDDAQGLDERSSIVLQPGTFAAGLDTDPASSAVAAANTTVNVGFSKAQTQQAASALFMRSLGYVPSAVTALGNPSAFPAETWAAMQKFQSMTASTSTVGGANPLSAFYSIFLPAGIRHQLKQPADITFSYSTALSTSTDPNNINVWFYNATLGKFVLENTNRRLDTTAKTITVAVNHFSVFVVLDGAPVVSVPSGAATQDIVAYNFPNPSDCIVHSNVGRDTHIFGAGATFNPYNGTMIRYSLPPGNSETATIRIYSLSGQLVRVIDQGAVAGATTSYFPWACDNQSGKTVASGVYIGEIEWGHKHKYFKIAIVKGSGL